MPAGQYAYAVDPGHGLVEPAPTRDGRLLVLERGFTREFKITARLRRRSARRHRHPPHRGPRRGPGLRTARKTLPAQITRLHRLDVRLPGRFQDGPPDQAGSWSSGATMPRATPRSTRS
ncbi:hypothetical protein [Streptomyces sp. NPDC086023]|uniref:hypothetical protein n=1 Tax=Streptomyces sp. NPDC086023 TaxID=3365746 RepID=UPI0037CEB0FB